MRGRRFVSALLLPWTLLAGCAASWESVDHRVAQFEPLQRYQIWVPAGSHDWHAVRITSDSISGVPFFRDRNCSSCRLSVPLAEVDSVRTGGQTPNAAGVAAGFLGFILLLILVPIAICMAGGGQTCIMA